MIMKKKGAIFYMMNKTNDMIKNIFAILQSENNSMAFAKSSLSIIFHAHSFIDNLDDVDYCVYKNSNVWHLVLFS